ncbi:MAG: bifunctional D-glycero-beta-D-manno-heptose-7-phosphate kinase/D-glycero-beta-D-manno-heptose 1-phosphate adenylyltransferase HldE [Litorivicinus sp.]
MHGIPNFSNLNVWVVGDVMLDRYWQGSAQRISPEAPVPVVKMGFEENRLGGAANVALNLSVLGCSAHLAGLIGADEAGRTLRSEAARRGIRTELSEVPAMPTILKLRVLAGHHQVMRVDFEEPFDQPLPVPDWSGQRGTVVLSDYAKGTLRDPQPLILSARENGLPIIVDPKGTDWDRYRGASVLTPNWSEWVAVAGPSADEDAVAAKAASLLETLDLQALLITRSEKGMSLFQRNQAPVHIPTEARAVADVTGAGDTVVAALAAGVAAGLNWEQACRLANTAAGIVVGKVGTSVVSPRELAEAKQQTVPKVASQRAALAEQLSAYQARGERIVFTNGCFDILHAGHVSYLTEAASHGDRLVVAVNSDRSVRALKGLTRPVNHAEQRMAVLAGLAAVDHVIEFDEDTPEALLSLLKPDVLVKGGDYADVSEVVGHEIVESYGGRVQVLGVVAGVSTTNIIEKVQR